MKSFGLKEDIPKSKKHLNYETLDLKSKRIMNRLCNYLAESQIPPTEFFKEVLVLQTVKTLTKA